MSWRTGVVFGCFLAFIAALAHGPVRGDEPPRDGEAETIQQMRQLALAMLVHQDTFKKFPPPAILSEGGKPLLSWRVKLLPYLEEQALYDQFHLDEPWDSPNNKPLVAKMPKAFRCPKSNVADSGRTVYVVPRGSDTAFADPAGTAIRKITDGTSRTIAILEGDDDHAVIWTKPDDWTFDPDKPTAGLGTHFPGKFFTAFFDGSIHAVPDTVDKDTLHALITHAGREPVKLPD